MKLNRIVRVEPNRDTDHTETDAQKITALVICEGILDGVNVEVFEYGINPRTPAQAEALEKKITQAKELYAEARAEWEAFEARRLEKHAAWQVEHLDWQEKLAAGEAEPEDEPIYQAPIPLIEPVYREPRDNSNENRVRLAVQEWLDNGGVIPEYVEPEPTDEEIRQAANRRLLALANPYSPEERETWPTQVTEATALMTDPDAEAPFLTARAVGRGISTLDLATVVLEKNAAFRSLSGQILSAQDRLLAQSPRPLDFDTNPAHWPQLPE